MTKIRKHACVIISPSFLHNFNIFPLFGTRIIEKSPQDMSDILTMPQLTQT